MKTAAIAFGLLLGLAACTATTDGSVRTASATSAAPMIGRCYFGGCSWFRVLGQRVLRAQGGERLVRASIAEGGSDHGPHSNRPASHRGVDIGWQPPTDDHFFFCSSARPMAILRKEEGGTGYDGLKLDFVNGSYGPTEAVSSQYLAVCHPGERTAAVGFAARHGYRGLDEGEAPSVDLATPEAVFALRR
jgi:hypothetical protein